MNTDRNIFNATKVGEWLDCLCESDGEEFLIELKREENETLEQFIAKCLDSVADTFEEIEFIRICDAIEAEVMGLDTY
jgi:hypothetical protein